jgi:hypothetical protein
MSLEKVAGADITGNIPLKKSGKQTIPCSMTLEKVVGADVTGNTPLEKSGTQTIPCSMTLEKVAGADIAGNIPLEKSGTQTLPCSMTLVIVMPMMTNKLAKSNKCGKPLPKTAACTPDPSQLGIERPC